MSELDNLVHGRKISRRLGIIAQNKVTHSTFSFLFLLAKGITSENHCWYVATIYIKQEVQMDVRCPTYKYKKPEN